MKPLAIIGILFVAACATPPPITSRPGESVKRPDAFMAAEAWIENGERSPAVLAVMQTWTAPAVERMHRDGEGYLVLVSDADNPSAVLLRLELRDGTWTMVEAKPERADYLWPSQ